MSSDTKKYTLAEVEALEVAPAAAQQKLQGWVPTLASDEELRQALEQAFDYRGDVTLTLKDDRRIEAYIFNRQTGKTLASSQVQFFTADSADKQSVAYSEIARIEFTGKDCAAGKQWEDWLKKYRERKAKGEKGIALAPEVLD